jgi:hypothetical protein
MVSVHRVQVSNSSSWNDEITEHCKAQTQKVAQNESNANLPEKGDSNLNQLDKSTSMFATNTIVQK